MFSNFEIFKVSKNFKVSVFNASKSRENDEKGNFMFASYDRKHHKKY